MKKILLVVCAIMATAALFAQDIIVTKDAKKIDAKILEVSKTEIKYKESDNLEGPLFILPIEDINSIIYSNGKVALYNQETPKDVQAEKKEEGRATQDSRSQQEQIERMQDQARESGKQLGEAIRQLNEVNNSYSLCVKNTTKHPYKINFDGHVLGVVNPYKIECFTVSVETYGRMQAVQTSGYRFSPTIKEFKIPRQQKNTACTVVIK